MRASWNLLPFVALLVLCGVAVAWLNSGPADAPEMAGPRVAKASQAAREAAGDAAEPVGPSPVETSPVENGADASAARSRLPETEVGERSRIVGRLIRGVPPQTPFPLRRVPLVVLERNAAGEPEPRFEGVTDKEGRFAVAVDGLQREWVLAVGEHERMPRGVVLERGDGPVRGELQLGELQVGPPFGLRFRVVDAVREAPLAGARAVVRSDAWQAGGDAPRFGLLSDAGDEFLDFTADAEGVVVIERLPTQLIGFEVFAPGHLTEIQNLALPAGGVRDLGDVRLAAAPRFDGVVLDFEGVPVSGARVLVDAAGVSTFRGPRAETTTDAFGRFAFEAVGRKVFHPRVEHPAHMTTTPQVKVTGEPVEIRFPPHNAIVGRVVDLPAGVAAESVGIEVRARPFRDGGLTALLARLGERFPVAADGSFRIGPMQNGQVMLRADAGEHGRSRWHVAKSIDTQPVVLRLDAVARAVTVRVVDAEGVPRPGLAVSWWNDPEALFRMQQFVGVLVRETGEGRAFGPSDDAEARETDARGEVVLDCDADAALVVRAFDGRGLFVQEGFEAGVLPAAVELVLPAAGTVSGVVSGWEAWSGESFRVEASLLSDGQAQSRVAAAAAVGAGGRFELGALEVGRYVLDVVAVGSERSARGVLQPAAGATRLGERFGIGREIEVGAGQAVDCELELPAPGFVEGRVMRRGEALARVQVWAEPIGPASAPAEEEVAPRVLQSDQPFEWSDRDGTFRFRVATAGSWRFWARLASARHDVRASGPRDVEVRPGETVRLDFVMDSASVRGRLEVPANPDVNRRISAWLVPSWAMGENLRMPSRRRMSGDGHADARVAEDGSFVFHDVAPGRFVLRFHDGVEPLAVAVPVSVARDQDVDIGAIALPGTVHVDVAVDPEAIPTEGSWSSMRHLIGPPPFGVRVTREAGEVAGRVWVLDQQIVDGRLTMDLPPGDYRLQMAEFARVLPGPSRQAQHLVESYATLRVAADGSAGPGVLVFTAR